MNPTEARFPQGPPEAGLYESFYLKASHPAEPLAVWIRYTVHKRPGAKAKGSLWFTLFDASAGEPRASKVSLSAPEAGEGDWIRIGESHFGEGRASGSARSERCDAAWELRFRSVEEPLLHLPYERMYRTMLPRTKTCSPLPAARFEGTVVVDGRELALREWPGVIGHNWGAEHAKRWIWLHGVGFEGEPDDNWLDVAIGRVRIGPLTTPWLASGALSLAGRRLRLGGLGRRATISEATERCDFTLSGPGVKVRGSVSAELENCVGWLYADPDGPEHQVTNCSIADLSLTAEAAGSTSRELRLSGGAAYELGRPESDPRVVTQPFPDG